MKRVVVPMWLNSLSVTPGARGEIVEAMKRYDNPPRHFINCTQLYRFVRDKLKKTSREHQGAAVALYDEYVRFYYRSGDEP